MAIDFISFLIGEFAAYLKLLLWLNWAGIIAFWLVVTCDWIEILHDLIVGTDFESRLEETDLQFPFMVATLGYISGKWIVYFVLYITIKYTLHKSAYSYDESVYKKIRIAIVAEIVVTIVATAMFVAADDGILITIGLVFAFFFIILDIGIPVTLNIMFIKKTYQIGKVYFRIVSMTSRSNSPPRASTTNTADLANELRPSNGPKAADGAASMSVSDAGGKGHKMDSSKTDTELSLEVQQTNGSEAGAREASATGNDDNDDNEANAAKTNNNGKDLSELFKAISKVAVLAVMITISSFIFFIDFMVNCTNDPITDLYIATASNIFGIITAFGLCKTIRQLLYYYITQRYSKEIETIKNDLQSKNVYVKIDKWFNGHFLVAPTVMKHPPFLVIVMPNVIICYIYDILKCLAADPNKIREWQHGNWLVSLLLMASRMAQSVQKELVIGYVDNSKPKYIIFGKNKWWQPKWEHNIIVNYKIKP